MCFKVVNPRWSLWVHEETPTESTFTLERALKHRFPLKFLHISDELNRLSCQLSFILPGQADIHTISKFGGFVVEKVSVQTMQTANQCATSEGIYMCVYQCYV